MFFCILCSHSTVKTFCIFWQIDKEIVLLSVLKEPVSRSIFDYALRSKDISSLFRHLLLRQKKRNGSIPECPIPEDPAIAQLLKKLLSQVIHFKQVEMFIWLCCSFRKCLWLYILWFFQVCGTSHVQDSREKKQDSTSFWLFELCH